MKNPRQATLQIGVQRVGFLVVDSMMRVIPSCLMEDIILNPIEEQRINTLCHTSYSLEPTSQTLESSKKANYESMNFLF